MKKSTFLIISFLFFVPAGFLFFSSAVFAAQAPTANAGPDLYINSGQTVVLQGSGYDPQGSAPTYYWNCNGGTLSSYNISQPIYTAPYAYQYNNQASYTCTLTVTNSYGLTDSDTAMVFVNYNTAGSGNYYGSGSLSVSKKVINLTSRNLNWQASVNANPFDILAFAITLQANGRDFHNITVRDILPSSLIYRGNLLLNAANSQGNPANGINIGNLSAGEIYVISYQAQAGSVSNFTYGTTTLSNTATVISTEAGSQTATTSVIVNNSAIQGATYLPTGLTNNPIKDSFFFPVTLILLGSWFYFSGNIYKFSDWLETRIN